MRHTIVIEVPDYIKLDLEEIEETVTGAIEGAELVYAREIHRPIRIVEYHREQITEPSDEPEPHCAYRDCERDRRPGWTTCDRHYSAGRTVEQERVIHALVEKNRENV